jgi:hypothetical protein
LSEKLIRHNTLKLSVSDVEYACLSIQLYPKSERNIEQEETNYYITPKYEPGNLLVALISSISSPPAERAVTHQQAALEGPTGPNSGILHL